MAAGFGGDGERGGEGRNEGAEERIETLGSDGWEGPPGALPVPISGSRAERYQVVLHVEAETLEAEGESGRSEMEDGTRVSGETSRRLACDAGVVDVMHAANGRILDVGRRRRTVPPAIRRALEARDGGCRFPGCGIRFTDAHHVTHWGDGGETKVENLVLLCRHHHRLVHEGGWKLEWWGWGRPVFYDPRGGTHYDGRWRLGRKKGGAGEPRQRNTMEPLGAGALGGSGENPAAGGSGENRQGGGSGDGNCLVDSLVGENRRRGTDPHGGTLGARWKEPTEVPDRVWFRALEAVAGSGV